MRKTKTKKKLNLKKKLDHLPGPFMVHVISSNSEEEGQRLGWEGLRRGRIFLIISYTKSGLKNRVHADHSFANFIIFLNHYMHESSKHYLLFRSTYTECFFLEICI